MISFDEIDRMILSILGKNSRVSSLQICNTLKDMGYDITDRTIRQRLSKLEKRDIILGYSTILNPSIASSKVNRIILVKFKFSKDFETIFERLNKYTEESFFCIYSSRILSGEYDWICHFVFDSNEQFELERHNFLSQFADIISDFRSYESKMIKVHPYTIFEDQEIVEKKVHVYKILTSLRKHENLNDKLQEIVESLVKYFHATFARVWLLDNKKKNLVLKVSAGKYKNIHGEFSVVSIDSLKIGQIVKTRKPAITNDVVHDPRIRHPDWAKKENLKSFAGYPLMYKDEAIGVLAMFSEKKLLPADFELLGIFCNQISNELTLFFEAFDFLAVK
jgi:DNA-binding Lrp family transcriptional regulator